MFKKITLFLVLSLMTTTVVFAQSGNLKGKVTDSQSGESLPGVNIYIDQLERGAATDMDGNYELSNIPYGTYFVRISLIGYLTLEEFVTIDQSDVTYNISIEVDVVGLEDVVVTGYTDISRNRITGSLTTVSNKDIESIPVGSFDQMLQGRAPGVFISTGSGQPGESATIRIRGSGSITGSNTPLFVMDGIPISSFDFASINPNDIENISILRDASATAQYGSRGANGVIIVTTKRGNVMDAQVRYTAQYGYSEAGDPPFDMMNTEEKLMFEEMIQIGPGWATSENNPNGDPAARAEYLAVDNNWADIFFRRGYTQTHDLSVAGGNKAVRYYVSGSAFQQDGIGLRSALERYSMRVNIDVNARDNFDIGFRAQGGYSESDFIESEGGVFLYNSFAAAYLANPYERLYDDDGELAVGPGLTGANAYDALVNDEFTRNEIKVVGQAYARYRLNKFSFTQQVSLDFRERYFSQWRNPLSTLGQGTPQGGSGSLTRSTNRLSGFTSNTNARYANEFAGKHQVDVFVANELILNHFQSFGFTGYGLNPKLGPTPASITPGSPTNNLIPSVGGGFTANNLWSVFGIFDYSFDRKYNAKVTIRRDGSSRFGPGNQYALLWSMGTSWVATNEEFLSDNDILSNLIVRLSYGKTGNQFGIGDYQRLATFASTSFAGQTAIIPATPGNNNLQWETAYKLNLGFDFSFLSDRISGTLDLYNDRTEDLFINQQLSRTTGFSSLEVNAGSVRNRGIEIDLRFDVIRTQNSLLTFNGNYAYNDNEIMDLGQVDEFELGTSIIREGLPLGTHYVVGWAGVDPASGAPLFLDQNGNVTREFSDDFLVAKYGSWLPTVTGGFGLDYSYRNFSVRAQFNYSYGNNIFNNQLYFQENPNFGQYNQRKVMLTMWQEPGDLTEIQSNAFPRQFTSKDIEDASYLRLRNILVSYTIPGNLFRNQIKGVRIFVQAQNLLTFTKFTGFDPEDYNNIAQYAYPLPRIFTSGVDINF